MKKRLLAFVMASVMAVGLTGCGGGEVGAGSTMGSGSAAGTGSAAGASQGVSGGEAAQAACEPVWADYTEGIEELLQKMIAVQK